MKKWKKKKKKKKKKEKVPPPLKKELSDSTRSREIPDFCNLASEPGNPDWIQNLLW